MAFRKKPIEKFETALKKLKHFPEVTRNRNKFYVRGELLMKFTEKMITYYTNRYYPNLADPYKEENFSVSIILNHQNLEIVNKGNPVNPPKGAKKVVDLFKSTYDEEVDRIYLGHKENKVVDNKIYVTKEFYDSFLSIDREEGKDKKVRVFNRFVPFLNNEFGLDISEYETKRDYSLLLKEILASKEFTQEDIIRFSNSLESGKPTQVVIEKQINKQAGWLISSIEEILDLDKISKSKAKDIGHKKFGYLKKDISGPEDLMEKILTDYGQNLLFGVPALLNINKYIKHEVSSNSQFDLLLINHLGDIEIVELKRPDQYVFQYGDGRGKFYPSKDLAIAIAQTERYLTATFKDNDEEYIIDNRKLRDFINEQVGETMFVESIRPRALIIIGSWKKLSKPYEKLNAKTKSKVVKSDYDKDGLQAYKELKDSLKNITIMTYSELLDNARTRLELAKKDDI